MRSPQPGQKLFLQGFSNEAFSFKPSDVTNLLDPVKSAKCHALAMLALRSRPDLWPLAAIANTLGECAPEGAKPLRKKPLELSCQIAARQKNS